MLDTAPPTLDLSRASAPWVVPSLTRWAVERALHRHGAALGLDPVQARAVLLDALTRPIRAAFGPVSGGTVRLGATHVGRTLLRLDGLRVWVPSLPGELDAANLVVVHRAAMGAVRVRVGLHLGRRDALEAAARHHGLCPELPVGLLAAVVASLGKLHAPAGAVVKAHLGRDGWHAMRLVDVVREVRAPVRELGLLDARLLVDDARVGQQVGVSLPGDDWLTPLLFWAAQPG